VGPLFDSLAARSLAGTDGAQFPFWSPDSRWIDFFAHYSALQKIDITGGPPISVASALAGNGGTWSRDGVVVFGTGATRLLYRVSAAGGEVVPLTKREKAATIGRLAPYFLPDGNHYLYEAPQAGAGHAVYVSSLDSDTSKLLVHGGTSPAYQQDTYSTSLGLPSSRDLSMRSGWRLLAMRPRLPNRCNSSRRHRLEPFWPTGRARLKTCHNSCGLTEAGIRLASWAIRQVYLIFASRRTVRRSPPRLSTRK